MLTKTIERIIKWTQRLPAIIKRKSEPPKVSLPYNGVLGYHYGELSEDTIRSISQSTVSVCDEFQFSPLLTLAVCFLASGFYPNYHKFNTLKPGNQSDWLSYRWGLGGLSPEWLYSSIQGSTEDLLPLLLDPIHNIKETVKRMKRLHNEDFSPYNRRPIVRIGLTIESFFNDDIPATKQNYLKLEKDVDKSCDVALKARTAMKLFLDILNSDEKDSILDTKRFPNPTEWMDSLVVRV